MSKFSEQSFKSWMNPASETEEQRISHTISMIKDAIKSSDILSKRNIEYIVQGSYGNNTNVRRESDIDICVMLKDNFYSEYPSGLTREHYGFEPGNYSFHNYRKDITDALITKFGADNIKNGNKSIKISSNSCRVEADVVPAFQYRNYNFYNSRIANEFIEGIKLYSYNTQEEIINYPKIHIDNGKYKNKDTGKMYKRIVRVFKRIKYKMIDSGISVNKNISSFLIECLIWNVPNCIFNEGTCREEVVASCLDYLINMTLAEEICNNWKEVSGMLYLFHQGRKWDVEMVNLFLKQMKNYLEL